jgi:hypothetical protein
MRARVFIHVISCSGSWDAEEPLTQNLGIVMCLRVSNGCIIVQIHLGLAHMLLDMLVQDLSIDFEPFMICRVGPQAGLDMGKVEKAALHFVTSGHGIL